MEDEFDAAAGGGDCAAMSSDDNASASVHDTADMSAGHLESKSNSF